MHPSKGENWLHHSLVNSMPSLQTLEAVFHLVRWKWGNSTVFKGKQKSCPEHFLQTSITCQDSTQKTEKKISFLFKSKLSIIFAVTVILLSLLNSTLRNDKRVYQVYQRVYQSLSKKVYQLYWYKRFCKTCYFPFTQIKELKGD